MSQADRTCKESSKVKYLLVLIFAVPVLVYSLILADSEGFTRAEGSYLECMIKNPKATPLEISNCVLAMPKADQWRAGFKYERLFKK